MLKNLVVFQKPCTKILISYWELRPTYKEFRYDITCEDTDFGDISKIFAIYTICAMELKIYQVENLVRCGRRKRRKKKNNKTSKNDMKSPMRIS